VPEQLASHYSLGMTTNDPPQYPGDSTPGDNPPPAGPGESGTSGLPSYGSVPPPDDAAPPPPPPPPPPPAPEGSAEGFSAPDAIGFGWNKFKDNVGPILVGVLIVLVVSIVVNILAGIVSGGGGSPFGPEAMEFSVAGLLANLVSTAVSVVLSAVFARAALDVVDGRPFDFMGAFGRLNLVNVLIAALLVSVIVTIGFLLLVIPGLVALFLTWFTTLFIVDDDAESPVKAIGDSVKLISSNVGDALLLALLSILVMIAGVIALVVGLVVAYPVVAIASAYAYRRFRGQPVSAAA
jgi:uncharacterized membrane protein